MASEGYVELGIIETAEGPDVKVFVEPDGTVVFWEPDTGHTQTLDTAGRDKLRELLDRAAMPGQPLAADPAAMEALGQLADAAQEEAGEDG
jgi:hypothetical protein